MEKYETIESSIREDRLLYSGLLAMSVAAMITCISINTLDIALTVAIYSFVISIPMLSIRIYLFAVELNYKYTIIPSYMSFADIVGVTGSLVGINAIMWHFSWIIGVVFLVMSAIAGLFAWCFTDALDKVNKDSVAQQDAATDAEETRR